MDLKNVFRHRSRAVKFKRAFIIRSVVAAGLAGWPVLAIESARACASPQQVEAAKPAQEEEKKA